MLEKIATFTTSQEFIEDDEADTSASDGVDPDTVFTTGSDADSAGGSKVVATSVDGEPELVDVAMKESNGADIEAHNRGGNPEPPGPEKKLYYILPIPICLPVTN